MPPSTGSPCLLSGSQMGNTLPCLSAARWGQAPTPLPQTAPGLGGGHPALLLVPGQEGETGGQGDLGTWGCATPSRVSPGMPGGHSGEAGWPASSLPSSSSLEKGPGILPPTLAQWPGGGHWCPCPPSPPHHRRSCKRPTPPTFSSTPSSECCWLTSSRPCSSSSPVTPSPSPLNSLPASSPPGPPLPPLWLPAPRLATLRLMGNKAAGTACPGSFALGKLRHGEGNGC